MIHYYYCRASFRKHSVITIKKMSRSFFKLNVFFYIFFVLVTIQLCNGKSLANKKPETLTPRPISEFNRNKRMDDYLEDHDIPEPKKMEGKASQGDAVTGYYDFLVNEGSFKFWATFQVVTAAILIYSAFAANYYAKFNVIAADYDDDYDWLRRSARDVRSQADNSAWSNWWGTESAETFQRILEAISTSEYTNS